MFELSRLAEEAIQCDLSDMTDVEVVMDAVDQLAPNNCLLLPDLELENGGIGHAVESGVNFSNISPTLEVLDGKLVSTFSFISAIPRVSATYVAIWPESKVPHGEAAAYEIGFLIPLDNQVETCDFVPVAEAILDNEQGHFKRVLSEGNVLYGDDVKTDFIPYSVNDRTFASFPSHDTVVSADYIEHWRGDIDGATKTVDVTISGPISMIPPQYKKVNNNGVFETARSRISEDNIVEIELPGEFLTFKANIPLTADRLMIREGSIFAVRKGASVEGLPPLDQMYSFARTAVAIKGSRASSNPGAPSLDEVRKELYENYGVQSVKLPVLEDQSVHGAIADQLVWEDITGEFIDDHRDILERSVPWFDVMKINKTARQTIEAGLKDIAPKVVGTRAVTRYLNDRFGAHEYDATQ